MYSSDDFQQETETSHSHTYIGTGQASIMPRLCRTRMSLYPQIVGSEKPGNLHTVVEYVYSHLKGECWLLASYSYSEDNEEALKS